MNSSETRIGALLELFEQKEIAEEFDKKFCQTLTEIFNAKQASIFEYDPTIQRLCFRYSLDMSINDMTNFKFRLGEGICGNVALTEKTIACNDTSQFSQHSSVVDTYIGKQTHSLLAAPAIHKGRCLAVIEILNKRSGPFDETDKAWARTFIIHILLKRFLYFMGLFHPTWGQQ